VPTFLVAETSGVADKNNITDI